MNTTRLRFRAARLMAGFVALAFFASSSFTSSSFAQATSKPQAKKKKASKSLQIATQSPATGFAPTANFDSNSVGYYFFPANLGAKWTMRTISQVFDGDNKLVKVDTQFSYERVISDSNRMMQGLPELICESSLGYHAGEQPAKVEQVAYYVDDSVIMAVFNHSINNEMNHTFLMNPLKVGTSWPDVKGDTIRSTIIAVNEPVTVPVGSFAKSIVVRTAMPSAELSKYFVAGYGLVKAVYRGNPTTAKGTYVVTSDLYQLDRGNERKNIKYQFQANSTTPSTPKKSF